MECPMKFFDQRFNTILAVLFAALFLAPAVALSQIESEGESALDPQKATRTISDVERIQGLQADIEADKAKLGRLQDELLDRQAQFEQLSNRVSDDKASLEAKQLELDALGATDTAGAASLTAEIKQLEIELELAKTQSELAFQTEKGVREQIQSLEAKLEQETEALNVLRGVAPAEVPAAAPAPETEQPVVAEPGAALPGMPAIPQGADPVATPPVAAQPATADQIEARRDASTKEQSARQAEQAVVDFIGRKEALQEQIAFEKQLRETTEQAAENFELLLETQEQKLADLIDSGADRAELQTVQKDIARINAEMRKVDDEIDQRRENIADLNQRLQTLQQEQIAVIEQAEKKRAEAESALKKSIWLESALYPPNVLRWAVERGPRILAVIVIAALLLLLIHVSMRRLARLMVHKGRRQREAQTNRADTLALSFGSAATVIVLVGSTVLVFQEAGVDLSTILGGAAIIGVAFAFGAQNLMRDYFNGFVILLEDQYELNDLVKINNITGTVERVNMRTTVLRDVEGMLHFIPNGEIKSVINRTYEWARPVFNIKVAYKENVDRVMEVLAEVAGGLKVDPDFGPEVTDEPVMLGVDQFVEDGVVIKFMIRTTPHGQFRVRREVLRRIKNRFDELGIEIPAPQRVLYHVDSGGGNG